MKARVGSDLSLLQLICHLISASVSEGLMHRTQADRQTDIAGHMLEAYVQDEGGGLYAAATGQEDEKFCREEKSIMSRGWGVEFSSYPMNNMCGVFGHALFAGGRGTGLRALNA